jgi:hypothetical protein
VTTRQALPAKVGMNISDRGDRRSVVFACGLKSTELCSLFVLVARSVLKFDLKEVYRVLQCPA